MARASKADGSPARTSAATLPSRIALWASSGSPATSPMAKIRSSEVRCCSSTTIKPFSSHFTRVVSKPIPWVLGCRPTAMSTLSKACCGLSTSPSNVTSTLSLCSFSEAMVVLKCIASNIPLSLRIRGAARSGSAARRSRSLRTARVTRLPRDAYTVPSSNAI